VEGLGSRVKGARPAQMEDLRLLSRPKRPVKVQPLVYPRVPLVGLLEVRVQAGRCRYARSDAAAGTT